MFYHRGKNSEEPQKGVARKKIYNPHIPALNDGLGL